MTERRPRARWLLVTCALTLALALPGLASALSWSVKINPRGSGTVEWETSSPPANGVLTKSGSIKVDQNAFLDLTFIANPGYELFTVFRDSANWTFLLDANDHFQFGPVGNSHKIVATIPLIVPTGSFEFPFPTDNPLLTAIAFLTGNYTGTMPGPFVERTYDFDIAMDEKGKIEAMGLVEGATPEPGADPLGASGKIKTVDGQPMMQVKVKFEGMLDGMPASLKAKGESPMNVEDLGGMPGIEGSHSYSAKLAGVKFKDKNIPVQAEIDETAVDNVARDWSLMLDISEQTDAKGKLFYAAGATLILQNGDMIVFPEKKAKYKADKGYKLSFSKGMNVTAVPPRVEKKPKIKIKELTFLPVGEEFEPTGGEIDYKFFGQKGKASLLDFIAPAP